ncbi:thioesterase family protein [Actinomadura opuntiae]|uniref:thioesterase family protein n=1 Tax=Actinomadura sp. OS1-43 TaxID=604315 RepID=UPI00255B0935|nr:thioesterase family protein [Actinomadura sp. OS1-43]MDL4814714.1 thioesterase family protein [Actinomadura sp. OS1-43]
MDGDFPQAFYEPLGAGRAGGERFASTRATAGPWSPAQQHAGPVAGMMGRAFERTDPAPGARIARVTLEILSPVPVAELEITTRVVRPGRRIALLEGELTHEGRPVVRATAWRIRRAPAEVPGMVHAPAPPPLPGEGPAFEPTDLHTHGYLSAMEWRLVEGTFFEPGPGTTWARSRVPLVAGEPDTPLVRALVLADSASGVGSQLDVSKWLIVNTDLTVALHRDPDGEWLCMGASVSVSPQGGALCEATLSDGHGEFGRVLQTMIVDELPGS